MRFISDLQSAQRGEITVLSLVESLLAVLLYVWLCYYFTSLLPIAIASLTVPMWLFRTRQSVQFGRKMSTPVGLFLSGSDGKPGKKKKGSESSVTVSTWFSQLVKCAKIPIVLLLFSMVNLTASVLIRLVATSASFLRHPLIHIVAFRKNWRRIVLATDIGCIPEIIPGILTDDRIQDEDADDHDHSNVFVTHHNMLYVVRYTVTHSPREIFDTSELKGVLDYLQAFIYTLAMFMFYIFPYTLRLAVKGAAVFFAPLFFVISSDPINVRISLTSRLRSIRTEPTSRLKLAYSLWSILALGFSLFFPTLVNAFHDWVAPYASGYFGVLSEFYIPPTVKMWQVASAANGVLFIYLYLVYAPRAAERLEEGVWRAKDVKFHLDCVVGIQMVLSVYSTVCGLAILAQFVMSHRFPAREWQWFPAVA